MSDKVQLRRRGFSLAETMIALSVTGTLLAWVFPGFRQAETNYRSRLCGTNLATIEGALDQWAIDHRKKPGDRVTREALIAEHPHLELALHCPEDGTYPTVFTFGESPRCSVGTRGDSLPGNDHVILPD